MERILCKSKIHRATVTQADLDYEGSCTIDANLLKMADIMAYEEVHIWNVTNGSRMTTYAIEGEPDSGVICINGAAAHYAKPGDVVIIASFARYSEREARNHRPRLVFVDENNRPVLMDEEVPGPKLRTA